MLTRAERDARIVGNLDELATDIGRLLRRLTNGREVWTDGDIWTLERLAGHVERLYGFFEPSAGELVACTFPGDDVAVDAALGVVDARTYSLRVKLGLEALAVMRAREWRERRAEELAA